MACFERSRSAESLNDLRHPVRGEKGVRVFSISPTCLPPALVQQHQYCLSSVNLHANRGGWRSCQACSNFADIHQCLTPANGIALDAGAHTHDAQGLLRPRE
jgi:hypothetical protein